MHHTHFCLSNFAPMRSEMLLICAIVIESVSPARAAFLQVYGGPSYDSGSGTGYFTPQIPYVNDSGTAVGYATKRVGGTSFGTRAFQWSAQSAPSELGNLGTSAAGNTTMRAIAINDAGQSAGYATKYVSGANRGTRAVRWDSAGVPVELGNLGLQSNGNTTAEVLGMSAIGESVGSCVKYIGGVGQGQRPTFWTAAGSALELANLGASPNGVVNGEALEVNTSGASVGYVEKFVSSQYKGERAVRWDKLGQGVELQNLGVDATGMADSHAVEITESGVAMGSVEKFVAGVSQGHRPVRWDSAGNVTELATLGADSNGIVDGSAGRTNASGVSVGYVTRYAGSTNLGARAVVWDAANNILELATMGTTPIGYTSSTANDINAAGLVAGVSNIYDAFGQLVGGHAVYWNPDGSIVDLNALIDPNSGWVLKFASDISDTNWVVGTASYDPDGPGGVASYSRLFLLQVPEPSSTLLLGGGLLLAPRRRS